MAYWWRGYLSLQRGLDLTEDCSSVINSTTNPRHVPKPTVSNCCLGFADRRNYRNQRPARGSEDWGQQGIYAIMEPDHTHYGKDKPILYVGKGNIGDRLENHFKGQDGQDIGKYLSKKKGIDDRRLQLDGIKVYWKLMCEHCSSKLEDTFIKCVENSLGYHPHYNRIAGSH
uniref:GIY-YIG domain-containing protein n=1 Tax=Branchiostoma floridae TaxID=7739 RepID=C3Z6Q0_BRAFL|eukprot:XP_002595484.1 hypothetical protein BRAFLDRAFT_69130 [Branchiostoma floridae]